MTWRQTPKIDPWRPGVPELVLVTTVGLILLGFLR